MTTSANNANGHNQPIKNVPLLDIGRQHAPLRDEMVAALGRVVDSGAFVLGPEVANLEKTVAAYCGVKHAVGCASGSDALLLALMAINLQPGDEVIVPSFTFFATASAVTRLGGKVVFADIDPATYNMAPAEVERLVTAKTKAILPVHLFGQCADMDALLRIGHRLGIPVIEDAAQAIGAEWQGRRAGAIGKIGCFSFYPTKNLGGAGDGGMITTDSDELADALLLLRGHGMRPRYYHKVVGINSRLDSFQAAVLNVKMPHLDRWTQMRQANANRYTELFMHAGLEREIGLPVSLKGVRHVWNQYVVRIPGGKRDAMRQFLAEAKIGSEIYYPLGLHDQECYKSLGYSAADLPETARAAAEVLALPIFPELEAEEQKIVVQRMAAYYQIANAHVVPAPKFLSHAGVRQA